MACEGKNYRLELNDCTQRDDCSLITAQVTDISFKDGSDWLKPYRSSALYVV